LAIERGERGIPQRAIARTYELALSKLDPDTPLPGEQQIVEHWGKVQSLSLPLDAYEARLAKQWWQIGCSIEGAPYVLTSLVRILGSLESPFSRESTEVPRLAARFLADDCEGGNRLSDNAKAKLKELRRPAAQSLPNQNAEPQRP
jgi:hypothetical protein